MKSLYRIGELADLAGVSPRTIDYYTQVGLLQACCRSEGNYRLYDTQALDRLKVIRAYKEQGLQLVAIQARLAQMAKAPDGDLEKLRVHLEQIRKLVDQMMQECAEIAEAKPKLRAAAARDQQMRIAMSRVAGDVLHKAIMLSSLITSTVDDVGVSPII
ncbi:MAG: MerR family transcriptional regulator [Chloroflexota bacterium]